MSETFNKGIHVFNKGSDIIGEAFEVFNRGVDIIGEAFDVFNRGVYLIAKGVERISKTKIIAPSRTRTSTFAIRSKSFPPS